MTKQDFTDLLLNPNGNKKVGADELFPLIYGELKQIASRYLRRERADNTFQPTALVHESYFKMVDITQITWQNKAHFLGVAANQMRRILVDYARQHHAEKRGGEFHILTLNEKIDKAEEQSTELIALDDALVELTKMDPVNAKLVELRYFGGLTVEETAEVLGFSAITVKRHWRMTKAWLYGQFSKKKLIHFSMQIRLNK